MRKQEYDRLIYYNYLLSTKKWKSIYDFLAELCVDVYIDITKYYNHNDTHPVLSLLAGKIIDKINMQARQCVNSSNRQQYKDFFLNVLKNDVAKSFICEFSKYFIVISHISESGEIIYDTKWREIFESPVGVSLLSKTKDKDDNSKVETVKDLNKDHFVEESKTEIKVKDLPVDFREKRQKSIYIPETIQEKNLAAFWNELTKDKFDYIYIWRNQITKEQYEELKHRIISCPKQQLSKLPQNYPNILVVYIAEWYKREYKGNEKENPLKALKLEQSVEKLWNNANLPDYLLYSKKNRMYLDSLYVLGGLPINYLVKNKNTTTFKKIVDQLSSGNSFVLSNEQDKNSIFTNYSIMKSITSDNGSLRLYFNELLENAYPIHPDDQNQYPFSLFISNLKEWKPMRQKFCSEWLIEGNLHTEILRRKFCLILRPERDGLRHKSLSYDRLASWGIDTNIQTFSLCLSFNDEDTKNINKDSEHITFINCHDNYFVAKYSSNRLIFSDIPTYYIHKVTLVALYNYGIRRKITSIDVSPFQQFYETSCYNLLSSVKREGKTYALLPYETILKEKEYTITDKKYFEDGDTPYKLVEIKDTITILSNSNGPTSLYSKESGIKIVTTSYNDTILYQDNERVLHRYINNSRERIEEYIPIFCKKSDLHVLKYERDFDPIELSEEEVCIEFKQGKSKEYKEWIDGQEPILGVVNVRVKAYGIKQIIALYYIPGKNFPIKRNVKDCTIIISPDLPLYKVSKNLNIVEQTPSFISFSDSCKTCYNEDIDILWIGDENDYVELPVIRPFNVIDILVDEQITKTIPLVDNTKINLDIPFILKDHFMIRKISEKGIFFESLKDLKNDDGTSLSYLNFEFKDEIDQLLKTFKIQSDVGEIKFYLCSKCLGSRNNTFFISDDARNYRFYYWTMNLEDEPIQLQFTVQKNILLLCLDDLQMASGIIFQSLEDNLLPITYFEPIVNGNWPKLTDNSNLLSLKCVELAIKHRIPFRVFEPVYYLLQDTDSRLVDLAVDYLRKPSYENNDDFKYEGLYRLSQELYFSWLFLNRRTWIEMSIRLFDRLLYTKEVNTFTPELKTELKSKLLYSVIRLFNYCPNDIGYENQCSLKSFTDMCWNVLSAKTESSQNQNIGKTKEKSDKRCALVNLGNPQWTGYTNEGYEFMSYGEKIAQNALRFMAPVPVSRNNKSKVVVKGFTVNEYQPINKNDVRTERDLKQIMGFLSSLENTPNAYVVIEQFFRKYLCHFN